MNFLLDIETVANPAVIAQDNFEKIDALLTAAGNFAAPQIIELNDAATNAVSLMLTLRHNTSGGPATGYGSRILFQLESTTTINRDAASIDAFWVTATDASRTGALNFLFADAGSFGGAGVQLRRGGLQFPAATSITAEDQINISITGGSPGDIVLEPTGIVSIIGNCEVAGLLEADNLMLGVAAVTYAATTDLDFQGAGFQTLSLTGNVTFTTSNRAAGLSVTVKILCDGTPRTFTFPAWIFIGAAAPAGIAAGKTAILTLSAFGSATGDVVAAYAEEP